MYKFYFVLPNVRFCLLFSLQGFVGKINAGVEDVNHMRKKGKFEDLFEFSAKPLIIADKKKFPSEKQEAAMNPLQNYSISVGLSCHET